MKINKLLFLTALVLLLFTFNSIRAQQKITVVAASDLKFALDSIINVYQQRNPDKEVQVTYGSSGKFFEQIQNGAPFDVFFSADKSYPQKLKEKGFTSSDVKIYGIGKIVIWSKKIDPNTFKINSLSLPQLNKIAIANPDHAPYGEKAVESMKYYKVYEKVKNKLVFGENIAQTAQFVQLGTADIGIIALSLALSPNMKKEGGKYYIIPEKSHKPLEQGYVILKKAASNSSAVKFYNFMATPTAIAILTHFGFTQKKK
ncbi:molybdate ABC transporter substrate-binding protein [Flavobacterium gawalongense]|uniref:Molybdate ABC transporter substrate-binding protein n=1 Tax=Flavobacterium gawalongense TaxID=2594432 RepID=A0A553BLV3_9FLAO|nr:molybdate ABC transporter substrate-binding protein [Flavobacterium gawalongense]TRX01238.1 molybdate ABC transporter substrate-binding protein [Flavobacterium gawalongense]TRX05237.1 molybdate ABC transporter substrate-binding protein [Flavobacterium gawalongense]TRX09140.1 molybdate ABC transporter substrate-binding protein [Flavobacterium gawalongense]TRX09225.1 molybdate ABC transporter substrate-binding protein [Flavobacterium gawalongense]TRX26682.1 molybdate ABC transporter substrate